MKSGVFFTVKTVQGASVEGNRTNRGLFSRSQQQNRHTQLPVDQRDLSLVSVVLRIPPCRDHSRRQLPTYLSPPPMLATSILRRKLCNLSTIPLAQKCYLCLRYVVSPMSPGRTQPSSTLSFASLTTSVRMKLSI